MTDQSSNSNKGESLPDNRDKRVAMLKRLDALADKMIAVGQEPELNECACYIDATEPEIVDISSSELARAIRLELEQARQERIEARLDMFEAIVKNTVAIGLILAIGYYLAKLVETLI